jgi:acetyl esterase/lipase
MAPSFFTRLTSAFRLYIIKFLVSTYAFSRRIRPPPLPERPTYKKFYSVLPNLVCYVWIPLSYKASSSPPLPLLIDIHGGGFCFGHPAADDSDNAILCHKYGICIVSINYRKAPGYPFPIPVEDAAALIDAVLNDAELPVDKTKVAVCGYSTGGNLSLTATQLHGLSKRIKGVVAFYPPTVGKRPLDTANLTDMLVHMLPLFTWAYILEGQDIRDPLLAPLYAKRENLPSKLFILGCEYDILCNEARDFAEKMAKAEGDTQKKELGNGRVGWESGNITWEELKGLEHGFNQLRNHQSKPEVKKVWTERTEEMHANVAKWLFKEIYGEY